MRRLAVPLVAALCFAQQTDYRVTPRFAPRLEIEDLLDRADAAKDEIYATTAKRAGQPGDYYDDATAFRRRLTQDIEGKARVLARLKAQP